MTTIYGGGIKGSASASENSIEFQEEDSVASSTETTILSFTNSGADLRINSIEITGTARSEWIVYINTVEKINTRIGVGKMEKTIPMYDFKLATSDVIDVKATHYESATQEMKAAVSYWR